MPESTETDPIQLEYAGDVAEEKPPITFPYIVFGVFDWILAMVAFTIVPTYCLTRYQTKYFIIVAFISGILSIASAGTRSPLYRFAILILIPAALFFAFAWSLNHWAGGDDGPGLGWGLFVGLPVMAHAFLHFILAIFQIRHYLHARKVAKASR